MLQQSIRKTRTKMKMFNLNLAKQHFFFFWIRIESSNPNTYSLVRKKLTKLLYFPFWKLRSILRRSRIPGLSLMVDRWTRTIVIAGILPSPPLQTSEIPPVNSIRISPSSQTRIFCPARRKTWQKRRSSPRISTVHETCPLYFCGPRFRRNNPPVSSSLRVACFLRGPQGADNFALAFSTLEQYRSHYSKRSLSFPLPRLPREIASRGKMRALSLSFLSINDLQYR